MTRDSPLALLRRGLDRLRGVDERIRTLSPRGNPRGRVLFCADHAALDRDGDLRAEMARAWVEMGYDVDVLDSPGSRFVPTRGYAFAVDTRGDLAWLGPLLPHGCVRVRHLERGADSDAHAGADCITLGAGATAADAGRKPTYALPAVTDAGSRAEFARAYRDVCLRIHREVRASC